MPNIPELDERILVEEVVLRAKKNDVPVKYTEANVDN